MAAAITIVPFLEKVSTYVLNPLIILVFAIAFLVFAWGIVEFINSETSDKTRSAGKDKIVWGLVGMFIMFSAYGLVHLIVVSIPSSNNHSVTGDTGYLKF